MKKLILAALLLIVISAVLPTPACAKWWIFGKSDGEVSFRYIYVNDIGFEEKDVDITLYKDSLKDGNVKIRGRVNAGKSTVGAVRVSKDGKETWDKADLAKDGTFEYEFKPEVGKKYGVYVKAIDTTGKSNDIDVTHKEITVSDMDIKSLIREALNSMIEAYELEDARKFMTYVSDDFAADPVILDRAVKKDFTLFDSIDMKYSISSIASGAKGRIYVSFLYNRFLVSTKDGKGYKDQGTTEFVFAMGKKGPQVFSMKLPLIFGLSDAENVGTGKVDSAGNGSVINVADDGTVVIGPPTADPEAGSSSVPAPTNLAIVAGIKHHSIDLEFDSTLDFAASQGVYGVIVEESLNPAGPFYEVENKSAFDTFVRLTTTEIASNPTMLYYRVRVYKISSGQKSLPSNVATWNNI